MSVTSSIDSLLKPEYEPYSATASIANGLLDSSTSTVTGDRNDPLFSTQSGMGKQDFLDLLVKQLQYQDPLNPMDNTAMVSQLAQFSALEGSTNIEKAVNGLNDSFKSSVDSQKYSANSTTNASAVSLIGKQIRMAVTDVKYLGRADGDVPLQIHLGDANVATVRVKDADGKVVRTLETGAKDAQNSATVTWDGKNEQGEFVQAGSYSIAIDGADKNPALYAFVQDQVEGVRFASSGPLVKVGGRELSIANIMDVSIGTTSGGLDGSSASTSVALLGKTVRWEDNSIASKGTGEPIERMVNLGNRQSAQVEVRDQQGELVQTLQVTNSFGVGVLRWDGRISEGADFAEAGQYTFRIIGEENDPALYVFSEGKVDGVSTINGLPAIRSGGQTIPLSAILDIAVNPIQEVRA